MSIEFFFFLVPVLIDVINLKFQLSPKQSPPNAAIPPPPPPLPPIDGQSPPSLYKPIANGDINNGIITPNKKSNVKKIVPPVDDTRNDLLKAIRDGELNLPSLYICKCRKFY